MALINDNWLLSNPRRKRTHKPIAVQMSIEPSSTEWDKENSIVAVATFSTKSEWYVPLYLTSMDVDELASKLWENVSVDVRRALIQRSLAELKDSEILDQFESVLSERRKSRAKRA